MTELSDYQRMVERPTIERYRQQLREWREIAINLGADNERLKDLLRCAVDDFEGTHGRPNPEKYPNHWAVQARREYGESAP